MATMPSKLRKLQRLLTLLDDSSQPLTRFDLIRFKNRMLGGGGNTRRRLP